MNSERLSTVAKWYSSPVTRYLLPALCSTIFMCGLFFVPPASARASNSVSQSLSSPAVQTPLATSTINGVTVAVTWFHINAKRIAIEYTVSGLKQVSGYEPAGCPVQSVTLVDVSGQQYGKTDTKTRCIMDENWDFRVTHSFYDNLSSLKTKPLSLHFVTNVATGVNSGQITPADAQGNYTIVQGAPFGEFNFDLTASTDKDLTIQQSEAHGNGVNGLLRSIEFNPSFVASEICITLPTTADWLPEAALVSQQGRVAADGWEILNFKQSKAWSSANRCYRFTFPATLDLNKVANFQIEVERLVTSLPEVITEAQCNTARNRLATNKSGIAIACTSTPNGYTFEVAQKPADMSIDDAYRTSARAFSDVVEGPWAFNIKTTLNFLPVIKNR